MDSVSKTKRSAIMRAVKGKNTKIERDFSNLLRARGFRFSKNSKTILGKPDIVFKKQRILVFIDSCFWHGCPKHLRMPSSNKKYWQVKIERNIGRDKEITRKLKHAGWRVIRVWEHAIVANTERSAQRITKALEK